MTYRLNDKLFSSSATPFLHLPWGQRDRRGKLCQNHPGGLSCHICHRREAGLHKKLINKINKSTNRNPCYLWDSSFPCPTPTPPSSTRAEGQTDGWRSEEKDGHPDEAAEARSCPPKSPPRILDRGWEERRGEQTIFQVWKWPTYNLDWFKMSVCKTLPSL